MISSRMIKTDLKKAIVFMLICLIAKNSVSQEGCFKSSAQYRARREFRNGYKLLVTDSSKAAMVFTYCESACPWIIADMQRIEKAFTQEELEKYQYLLIRMDPEGDTPERFISFSKEYQLNDRWICISSSEGATMEMANVLNVKMKKLSGGGFDHSNIIHLIDKNRIIVFQQNGLAQEPTDIIKAAKDMIN